MSEQLAEGSPTTSRGPIHGLANFHKLVTVIVFWLAIAGLLAGVLMLINASSISVAFQSERNQQLYVAVAVLGGAFSILFAAGTAAAILDIMNNIRELNVKQMSQKRR